MQSYVVFVTARIALLGFYSIPFAPVIFLIFITKPVLFSNIFMRFISVMT